MTAALLPRPLPRPAALPVSGHLQRWSGEPITLLEEGAALARTDGRRLFRLNLGLNAVVGFGADWNRALLGDLPTFVSAGSFSRVVPYLSGGIILTDAPGHASRRGQLNSPFSRRSMETLRGRLQAALHATLPTGPTFDTLAWADRAVLAMLNAAYFNSELDPALLHTFLAPLRHPFPVPALPRPLLFARFDRAVRGLAQRRLVQGGDDLLTHLARLPGGLTETRVSLAAGHDTTTHTLAWAAWHLAEQPQHFTPGGLRPAIRETLRLYPPGWMGSRRLSRDLDWHGTLLKRGMLALYSPYLSGRDPGLWERPDEFWPERWGPEFKPPAWVYLPFGGGERTCLGLHLAQLMMEEALAALHRWAGGPLTALEGDPTPRPGVTLGPAGPLTVRATPASR